METESDEIIRDEYNFDNIELESTANGTIMIKYEKEWQILDV